MNDRPAPSAVARLLVTGMGTGLIPCCPGTWGSVLPCAGALIALAYGVPVAAIRAGLACAAALFATATIAWGRAAQAYYGKTDPGQVTSDEVAGQAVALLAVADPVGVAAAFLAFRLLDIVKPWPIHRLERLPGGWGILADDLAAGAAAAPLAYLAAMLARAG